MDAMSPTCPALTVRAPSTVEHDIPEGRAEAIALGEELRALLRAVTLSTADPDTLSRAAAAVQVITAALSSRSRDPHDPSPYDVPLSCGRAFAVGHGPANPFAPPLEYGWVGERVIARCTLDIFHEGPRGHAHGGVSAMLLDDVLARIPLLVGHGRVTRSLELVYRRPVPLQVPLVVSAALQSRDGSRLRVRGSIARADAPEDALVEASADFLLLRDDQLQRINPTWTPGSRWPD